MQTFLPYPDYAQTMSVLDDKRLGNQVYREALTLIRGGWPNHPASKMWQGYFYSLADYAIAGLRELEKRGRRYPFHVVTFKSIQRQHPNNGPPPWLGNEEFHLRHRRILLHKDFKWYSQFFNEEPMLPINGRYDYLWPEITIKIIFEEVRE